ncbi:MAG: exodeoxyribonuclease VII small subunit [Bacilli bacterium]|nr:exodeoxyribonuclease VII small subunit [Bacilli bacterium]
MTNKEKKFEEKLKELESIVKELENGEVDLDSAINKFNEAMKIAKDCNEKLTKAEEQVNKILTEEGKLENFETPEYD